MSFDITSGKGFHMTFENGYTISVQFGGCNYCSHYDKLPGYHGESETAEVAIWRKGTTSNVWETSTFIDGANDVAGHVTADEVAEIMEKVARQPKVEQ